MKSFIIYYEHVDYGYYSHKSDLEFKNIQDCLNDFIENYAYEQIYGIMQIA